MKNVIKKVECEVETHVTESDHVDNIVLTLRSGDKFIVRADSNGGLRVVKVVGAAFIGSNRIEIELFAHNELIVK